MFRELTRPRSRIVALVAFALGLALALCLINAARSSAQTVPSSVPVSRQTITITPADNGQTYNISVGDRVVVKMGTTLNWTVDVEPPGILVPVPGVGTLIRGVQGIYEAVQPGTATLTATGRPDCSGGGACPQFIQQVQVTIVVGPVQP
jgi:hypothetical protein